MAFINQAVTVLQTLVIALGAGLAVWGVVNLMEGYGNDNPGAKSQGIKQLMAGGGVVLIGTNYLKGLFALAFQGFLIMVCVGIYAVLINGMIIADNIHSALFSVAAYTVILCFSLFKTGSLAKSIFHAH